MFHTSLCPKACEIRHHDVVIALQTLAPRFNSSINAAIFTPVRVTRGNNKEDFKKHVEKLISTGWKKNKNVPENGKELQLPLLHLASMFGKYEAVDWLLNEEKFDAALRTASTNETALHLVARHLYKALSACESRLENMSASGKVANFEKVVSLLVRKEVTLFWAKDGVNRETALHILANHLVKATSVDVDLEREDQCLAFYSKGIDAIFKLLLAAKGLSRKDITQALSIKNCNGDTCLHILARASMHGYQLLKFLVKSLGSSDILKIKNGKNRSVLDAVNQSYPGHEKDLIIDDEVTAAKKNTTATVTSTDPASTVDNREAMELFQFLQNSAKHTLKLCREPAPLNRVTARRDVRCAIHTKYFPGSCSPDCWEMLSAVNTILSTHTPLCPDECDLQHHLLTCAVFNTSVVFRQDNTAGIPLTFKLCIQACLTAGWKRDMDVPDPLESLRYPLLHLICLRGNFVAAEKLAQEMKFRPVVSARRNETPLHVTARYFPVTYPDKIIADLTFKSVLTFLVKQDQGILFRIDAKKETVLHIISQCIVAAFKILARPSDSSYQRSCKLKQKHCYVKALKFVLKMLSDLQSDNKVCKRLICQLLAAKNYGDKTFIEVLRNGPDKEMAHNLAVHTKEELPFCFAHESLDIVIADCLSSSCPCKRKVTATKYLDTQMKAPQPEGEGPSCVQEPVSSSQSPLSNEDHSYTNQPAQVTHIQPAQATPNRCAQVTPNQPVQATSNQPVQVDTNQPGQVTRNQLPQATHNEPAQVTLSNPAQVEVVHASSSRRPQAQVQSIQVLGQAKAGNPSQQTNAVAQPIQHIPVVFIKQEPDSLEHDAQCFFTNNSHFGAHPQRQNANIIPAGPSNATRVQNLSPVQTAGEGGVCQGESLLQCSSQLQSGQQMHQGVTNVTAAYDQQSTISTQTTALLRQAGQARPSVSQTSQGRTSTPMRFAARKALSQVISQQRASQEIEDTVLEALASLPDTDYELESLHTPLCDKHCSIAHHHLILTLMSTSNRSYNGRGRVKGFLALLENTKVNFLKCVKKNLDEGFAKGDDIPDGLEILQYPLIHLASMLLRYASVDMLVYLGFYQNSCSIRTGEFPLHSTLRYCYETGLKTYKTSQYFEKLFGKVFQSLSRDLNLFKLLSQQDKNGDTPLHVAAKKLIERPAPATSPSNTTASQIPDSTQECDLSSSQGQPANQVSSVCNLVKITGQHQNRVDFYTSCLIYIFSELQERATKNGKIVLNVVKPVLSVKNNEGETFLQILCKDHHIAYKGIVAVLTKFPLVMFYNCIKQCVPKSCWPNIVVNQHANEEKTQSGVNHGQPVSSPLEVPKLLEKQSDAQPSKPESPKPSSDVNLTEAPLTASSTASEASMAEESNSEPSPATPLQTSAIVLSPVSGSFKSNLDLVLTPVVANPGHATLRPTTKRKIIEALKEEYTERLELAVKGKREVEEDILKHKSKTEGLTELMAKKRVEVEKMEKELQEMQKEMWHKNQAIQALENSLEQFVKEELELKKNLLVLQEADLEPPAKKSRTEESSCSE